MRVPLNTCAPFLMLPTSLIDRAFHLSIHVCREFNENEGNPLGFTHHIPLPHFCVIPLEGLKTFYPQGIAQEFS